MSKLSDSLLKINACAEAIEWVKTQPNADTAWAKCTHGDWMLWLIGKTTKSKPWSDKRKPLVLAAIDCAMRSEPYLNDDARLAYVWCLDALERWTRGEAEQDEVEAARDAAYAAAAAYAAYAAAYAAYAAADDAAAYAADAAAAAYAAAYAAYADAAYAAYAADAADADAYARITFLQDAYRKMADKLCEIMAAAPIAAQA